MPNTASKSDLWSYRHDLDVWFPRFAGYLQKKRRSNPLLRLLEADPEINPCYVCFALYLYRVPGLTLVEKGQVDADTALALIRSTKSRLREDAKALRRIAGFGFPPPWGRQLREMRIRLAPKSSPQRLTAIAAVCEEGASLLEPREGILKKMTSRKREPRNAYASILWTHMTKKIAKSRAGSILNALIDCADEAFGQRPEIHEWEKFELAAKRYRKMFPGDFATRTAEARRNRKRLSPGIAEMWRRLNSSDCKKIVDSLRPRFETEIRRLRKT